MESKESITYSGRVKAGERPQLSFFKNNQYHGYRSTKRWVEEASQQCRGPVYQEQQQQYQSEGATMGLDSTPTRAASRKKDKRGVHFKQENEQTASSLDAKVSNQASSLSPAILRKDCFSISHAAALSPISLNVAAAGRQAANSVRSTKPFSVVAALPRGELQTQDQGAANCPDGRIQTMSSGKDEEGRQVVWCNAAFEAEDDLRSYKSQDSACSNRCSLASCSKIAESDVSDPLRELSQNQNQEQEEAWASGISIVNTNPSATFAQENLACSHVISSVSAVAGSSPAMVSTKSPELNSGLPHIAELELEGAATEWYMPVDSESTSHSFRSFVRGNKWVKDLSKMTTSVAAMPSFKAAAPPASLNSNRHGPRARVSSSVREEALSSSSKNHYNFSNYCISVPSNYESASRSDGKKVSVRRVFTHPHSCFSNGNGSKITKRAGASPALIGKVDPHALNPPRNGPPKQQRFQHQSVVEADLNADIEHEIEEEISQEILYLSQRLTALHARRVGGGHWRSKMGGISCPQTPFRSAPSPCGSDSANNHKGRIVAAKVLQYKNDRSNVKHEYEKYADKSGRSAVKLLGFSDGLFLGRGIPPRRSLGTPSCLLTRGKAWGQQRSSSVNHRVKQDLEAQSSGNVGTKVTIEAYMRDRAELESGCERAAGVLSYRGLGDEERKVWNQWNDKRGQYKKKELQLAPSLSASSAAMHSHFYPEFERKVDWVKSLRNGPLQAAHPCGVANSPGQALGERFLKQKSERQDIHAWLRNIRGAEGTVEIPSFATPALPGTGMKEDPVLEEIQEDLIKSRMVDEGDVSTGPIPAPSVRPCGAWIPPSCKACTTTPTQLTLDEKTTPSSGNARMVPSQDGMPIKAASARSLGSRCFDSKLILESPVVQRWYNQTSPRKRCSEDTEGGFPMRKISTTFHKGYAAASGFRNGCIVGTSQKSTGNGGGGVGASKQVVRTNDEVPKVERKITVVEAEYERFVQEGVQIKKQIPEFCKLTPVVVDGHGGQGASQDVGSKPPSLTRQKDVRLPCSSASNAAKKIYIRCSDLIKDKHYMLVKGRQRCISGQSVLPAERQCQDSEDLVFASSNARIDCLELDENNSKDEDAWIVEECASFGGAGKDCQQFFQSVEGVQFVSGSTKMSGKSHMPDFDVVYDYDLGNPGVSYLPEDYTLQMMLQYVDTLKRERAGLPRVKATKDVIGISSPRDSGCIKRTMGDGRRGNLYFNSGGGGSKHKVLNTAAMDNEGLSPNEIEGLDLESFWCLVGELEGPIIMTRP